MVSEHGQQHSSSDAELALRHLVVGNAYCIAKSFDDATGNCWHNAGLLYFCGSEFDAAKQSLTLAFCEEDMPVTLSFAVDHLKQQQVLQQLPDYLVPAIFPSDTLTQQLAPLWQLLADGSGKTLQVAEFSQLGSMIPDTQLLFTEAFQQDELASIAARFAPFLYHAQYLPLLTTDYDQLLVIGYGASNANQIAYFDLDFGLCPLNCDLSQLLQQLQD